MTYENLRLVQPSAIAAAIGCHPATVKKVVGQLREKGRITSEPTPTGRQPLTWTEAQAVIDELAGRAAA